MKLRILHLAVALTLSVSGLFASKPLVIAHRGHWNVEGSAQNSIRALIKADSIGADATEFDVWLSADSVLVINHDATFNGVNMEFSTSDVIRSQKLANGENIPTLEEYLTVAKDLKPRIICEIKTHDSNAKEREAIKQTLAMIKKFGLEDRTTYVMFSKNGLLELMKMAPEGTRVQYPRGDYIPEQVKFMGINGVTYNIKVLKDHPDWIRKFHDLGIEVNVWTITEPEDMQWCIDNNVDYVTCNDPETLIKMIAEQSK